MAEQQASKAAEAVDQAIHELGTFDLIVDDSDGDSGSPPSTYLARHRHEYVRTVRDILQHRPPQPGPVRVMELGAFFGTVCIALASLGYDVTAADIPEYIEMPEQVARYARHGVKTKGVRLQDFRLPFEDESCDVVIMCEVLEHLNFNPLPLLKEINRVLAPGGIFYLSLPNYANIRNRVKVLKGGAPGIDVESFYEQLRPGGQVIVYGHWREYTGPEVRALLEPLGFRIERQYYFGLSELQNGGGLKKRLARAIYRRFPVLKENQTTIAIREKRTDLPFRIPATVHPELTTI
jgi:SAM-dependent methyltransferase